MAYAVAIVTPQTENTVARSITDLGFDVFNPQLRIPKVHRGRRVYKIEPMFRRYLMIKVCEKIREINFATVKYFVSFLTTIDSTIAVVPDKVVKEIKSRCTGDDVMMLPRTSRFIQGEFVRPKSGPFIDYMFKFEESSFSNKEFATLNSFGREVIMSFKKGVLVAA